MRIRDKKKVKEYAEKRKRQILKAAMDVFARKGFSGATTDEIMKAAGVGKGTLYRYFKNKEDLFLKIVDWGLEKLREDMIRETRAAGGPLKKIEAAIRTQLVFYEKHSAFVDMIVHQHSEFREKIKNKYFAMFYGSMENMRRTFRQGIEEKLIKKDINIDDCIWGLTSMLHGFIHDWYINGKKYSLSGRVPSILKMLFCGIVADKNRRMIYDKLK